MIRRDATAPIATPSALPVPNGNGWNNSDVTVTFVGSDATSGIASCTAPATFGTEGANQSSPPGTCTDNAGNTSSPVRDRHQDRQDRTGRNACGGAAAECSRVERHCGAGFVRWFGRVVGDRCGWGWTTISLTEDGTGQSATGSCADRAGNSASATASGIDIDRTAPMATATTNPPPNANGWNHTDVTVSFSGTDDLGGSGVRVARRMWFWPLRVLASWRPAPVRMWRRTSAIRPRRP